MEPSTQQNRQSIVSLLKQNSRDEFNRFDLFYLVQTSDNKAITVKGNKKEFITRITEEYSSDDVLNFVTVYWDEFEIVVG